MPDKETYLIEKIDRAAFSAAMKRLASDPDTRAVMSKDPVEGLQSLGFKLTPEGRKALSGKTLDEVIQQIDFGAAPVAKVRAGVEVGISVAVSVAVESRVTASGVKEAESRATAIIEKAHGGD